jgi:hypothetical protein
MRNLFTKINYYSLIKAYFFVLIFLTSFFINAQDIRTVSLVRPQIGCAPMEFFPNAQIANNGNSQIVNFYYRFQILGTNSQIDSVFIDTLKVGQTRNINLTRSFKITNYGSFVFSSYPSYKDVNASNDTIKYALSTNSQAPRADSISITTQCPDKIRSVIHNKNNSARWYKKLSDASPFHIGDTFNYVYKNDTDFYVRNVLGGASSTTYTKGNGQQGIMFGVIPQQTTNLDSLSFSQYTATNSTVDSVHVYYRVGTFINNGTTRSVWTLLTKQLITIKGANEETIVKVPTLKIDSGVLYSFYIHASGTNTAYVTIGYTTLTAFDTIKNQDLWIYSGYGVSGNFGGTFSPRGYNGTIYTSRNCPSEIDTVKIRGFNSTCPDDLRTVSISQPSLKCQFDSFQPSAVVRYDGYKTLTNQYYRFQLTGANSQIDSVLINSLTSGTSTSVTLPRYFKLNNNGANTLKAYALYKDDSASNDTQKFSFNIIQSPILSNVSQGTTICAGNSHNFSITISNVASTDNWRITYTVNGSLRSFTGTGTSHTLNTGPVNQTVDFTFETIENTTNGCKNSINNLIRTITVDPKSDGGVINGTADVCKAANKGALTLTNTVGNLVTWQTSSDSVNWSNINNPSFTFNYENLQNTTHYRVILKSGLCDADTSNVATIRVNDQTVAGFTSGSIIVCETSNAGNITLSGNNGEVLRWESSINNGQSWDTIQNTTTSISFTNLNQNTTYRAIVKNGVCAEASSTWSAVNIRPATKGGETSGSATVCGTTNSGNISLFSFVGNVVKWQSSTNGGVSWNDVQNVTSLYRYTNLTQTTLFRAIIKNGICDETPSTATEIQVIPETDPGNLNGDNAYCGTTNNGTVDLLNYVGDIVKWQTSNNGTNWTDLASTANQQVYSNLSQTTYYRAFVKNGNCIVDTSNVVKVSVDKETKGGETSGSTTLCGTDKSGTIELKNEEGAIIKWQTSTNGGSIWSDVANQTSALNYNNLTQNTQYRALVKSGICEEEYSSVSSITVVQKPEISIKTQTANKVVFRITNYNPEVTYKWTFGNGKTADVNSDTVQHNYTIKGNYLVKVKDDKNCNYEDTLTVFVNDIVSINQINKQEFVVYPNPAQNTVTVSFDGSTSINLTCNILTLEGKIVHTQKLMNSVSTIDISNLSNGMYFYELKDSNGLSTVGKLLIAK